MALALVIALPAPQALALACSEGQNKFVQRNAANPYSYGSMGSFYNNENITIQSCGLVVHSVHLYFASPGGHLDFAETGTLQYGDDRGHFHIFNEWSLYPYFQRYPDSGPFATNQWVSFNVSNEFGTYPEWKFQYSLGASQTNWITYGEETTSSALWYSNGIPMSEVERFGNSDPYMYAKNLKWRPSTGGWFAWEGMTCTNKYAQLIGDWDARRLTSNSWDTVHQTPPPGDC